MAFAHMLVQVMARARGITVTFGCLEASAMNMCRQGTDYSAVARTAAKVLVGALLVAGIVAGLWWAWSYAGMGLQASEWLNMRTLAAALGALTVSLAVWVWRLQVKRRLLRRIYVGQCEWSQGVRVAVQEGKWWDLETLGLDCGALNELVAEHEHWGRENAVLREEVARHVHWVHDLQAKLKDAEARASRGNIAEELRLTVDQLKELGDGFVSLLQQFLFPIGDKYEECVSVAEAVHERMQAIIDSMDESIASMSVDGDRFVLKVALPLSPRQTFASTTESGDEAMEGTFRKLVKAFHSDITVRSIGVPWAIQLHDAVLVYINKQVEALRLGREVG